MHDASNIMICSSSHKGWLENRPSKANILLSDTIEVIIIKPIIPLFSHYHWRDVVKLEK